MPILPVTVRTMSFASHHVGRRPVRLIDIVSGTRNHVLPSAQMAAISVAPMPVEKAPKAPVVQEWESAPTTTSPGSTRPSLINWWQMPPPISVKANPISAANSLSSFWSVAVCEVFAGAM